MFLEGCWEVRVVRRWLSRHSPPCRYAEPAACSTSEEAERIHFCFESNQQHRRTERRRSCLFFFLLSGPAGESGMTWCAGRIFVRAPSRGSRKCNPRFDKFSTTRLVFPRPLPPPCLSPMAHISCFFFRRPLRLTAAFRKNTCELLSYRKLGIDWGWRAAIKAGSRLY